MATLRTYLVTTGANLLRDIEALIPPVSVPIRRCIQSRYCYGSQHDIICPLFSDMSDGVREKCDSMNNNQNIHD